MDTRSASYIAAAEKLTDSIFVAFGDGKSAFFSADLLYANLLHAELIKNQTPEDLED